MPRNIVTTLPDGQACLVYYEEDQTWGLVVPTGDGGSTNLSIPRVVGERWAEALPMMVQDRAFGSYPWAAIDAMPKGDEKTPVRLLHRDVARLVYLSRHSSEKDGDDEHMFERVNEAVLAMIREASGRVLTDIHNRVEAERQRQEAPTTVPVMTAQPDSRLPICPKCGSSRTEYVSERAGSTAYACNKCMYLWAVPKTKGAKA